MNKNRYILIVIPGIVLVGLVLYLSYAFLLSPNRGNSENNSTPDQADLTEQVQNVSVPMPATTPVKDQTLKLVDFSVQKTTHALHSVTITVKNVTTEPQSGAAWYILAPPDAAEPWKVAVYSSPQKPIVELAAGRTVLLTFDSPDAALSGEYSLSVWVHKRDKTTGELSHSDGMGFPSPLALGSLFFYRIDRVELVPANAAGGQFDSLITFSVRNNTAQDAQIGLSYSIAPPNDDKPWADGLFTMPFKYVAVRPGENFTITYRDTVKLPNGQYRVTGWFHRLIGTTDIVLGDYAYPQPITIPQP